MYTGSVKRDDALLEEIDAEVARNNGNREWVMTMFDSITIAEQEARVRGHLQGLEEGHQEGLKKGMQQGMKQGLEQGLEEGQSRYAKLVDKLLDLGRVDDLKAANKDPEVRKRLFEEFGL